MVACLTVYAMTEQELVAKKRKAQQIANLINSASQLLDTASEMLEQEDLNLSNYPQEWSSFENHASELRNIFIDNWKVGESDHIQIAVD